MAFVTGSATAGTAVSEGGVVFELEDVVDLGSVLSAAFNGLPAKAKAH